jgi:hypothetical protein
MGTVSGTIQPYLSSDKNSYTVSLVKRNPNGISANIFDYGVPVMVDSQPSGPEDNSFQARACPGDYDVVLSERQHAGNNLWGNAPTQKIVFDTQQVTIASSGSSHVTFTPHAMASIEGEVRLDMVTKDEFCPQCQAIYVSILREGNGEFQTVTLSSGNRFDFHNVSPGEYQVSREKETTLPFQMPSSFPWPRHSAAILHRRQDTPPPMCAMRSIGKPKA